MGYDGSQVLELIRYNAKVRGELQDLMLRNVMEGESLRDQGAREYLHRGVGRRLNVIHLSISRIYDLFPAFTPGSRWPKRRLPRCRSTCTRFVVNPLGSF